MLIDFIKSIFIDKNLKKDIEFLKKVILFSDLSIKGIVELLQISNTKKYLTGEVIFEEGSAGKFYISLNQEQLPD